MTDQDGMRGDKLRDCFSYQVSEHGDPEKGNDSDDSNTHICSSDFSPELSIHTSNCLGVSTERQHAGYQSVQN